MLFFWEDLLKTRYPSSFAKNWAGLIPETLKYNKFLEQAWLAVHYPVFTLLGYFVIRDKPWWPSVIQESSRLAICATQEERFSDQQDIALLLLYPLQLGFYTLELVTLLTTRNRRNDALIYFFHHIY